MEQADLLALYDRDQRINVEWPNERREVTEQLVRHVSLEEGDDVYSFVTYAHLTPENADAAIQGEIDYFTRLGHNFEWKLFAHDTPPDLKDRLARHGFQIEEEEAIMVLDLAHVPESLLGPVSPAVRRITDPAAIIEILSVQHAVWGKLYERLADEMAYNLRENPDQLSVYAAYVDDKPVSSAWIRFTPNSQFGSLWGGSTLEAYRGQGHYTALLAVRAQEAIQRGRRFLTVDASPMSRPILEKHAFRLITLSWECNWLNPNLTRA